MRVMSPMCIVKPRGTEARVGIEHPESSKIFCIVPYSSLDISGTKFCGSDGGIQV